MSESEKIESLNDKIQYLITEVKKYKYDFLTGLKMRLDFDKYLKYLFESFEFEHKEFTFVLIDIIGLHEINRELGYQQGDELIKNTSEKLKNAFLSCKNSDCSGGEIFRIGGDEFAILVSGHDKERLELLLNSLEDVTTSYVVVNSENQFPSPSDLFKYIDKDIISKKLKKRE